MKYSLLAILLSASSLWAQKNVVLTIQHKLGTQAFSFEQSGTNNLGQQAKFSRVEYYLSRFSLIHDGGQITEVDNTVYILANADSPVNVSLGNYAVNQIEAIRFHVGVDAPTNTSDPTVWPAGHPLALKTPSMHWGWSSGYRFIALEGWSGTSLTVPFEMHGLWDANYFEQTVNVVPAEGDQTSYINLEADYLEALRDINIASGPIDHGVNATDLTALQNFRDHVFRNASEAPSALNLTAAAPYQIVPQPATDAIQLVAESFPSGSHAIRMFDATGKSVLLAPVNPSSPVSIANLPAGWYWVEVLRDAQVVHRQRLIHVQ